ncbi:SUKH-3 domain-containing protein [Aquimarina sp. 2201CG1-2-11]|uniref:SUKH-3 domain-containing protein n=1 Tax=Aquimarina discodermiae TaxID=3231043 RepID=UPI003462652A
MNKQNQLLICKEFADWKIVFYRFLDNKYNLIDLEKEIYKLPNLENSLGRDSYIDLLSYNYKDESQFFEIKQLLNSYIDIDDFYSWKLCNLFKKKGFNVKNLIDYNNVELPDLLLELYGGKEFGEIGEGKEQAKSNVTFLKKPLKSDLDDYWKVLIGEVVQVGLAHHGNIILFMNNEGVMFIYIEITNNMYIGGNFKTTMSKLLFGLDYGELIVKPNDSSSFG